MLRLWQQNIAAYGNKGATMNITEKSILVMIAAIASLIVAGFFVDVVVSAFSDLSSALDITGVLSNDIQ